MVLCTVLVLDQPVEAAKPKVPNLRGYVLMVAGSACPAGSDRVGFGGAYGAEDTYDAAVGSFLYEVGFHLWDDEPYLRRNIAPLKMTACQIR
jgi:hypothetical protein